MKVKFSRCKSNNLTEVPQVDGQLIFAKDTHDVYLDSGEERSKLTDIIFLDTLEQKNNLENPLTNKLYYVAEDNLLYHFNGTEFKAVKVQAAESQFDNTDTTLQANNVQDAVTELDKKVGNINSLLDKINGDSASTEVK